MLFQVMKIIQSIGSAGESTSPSQFLWLQFQQPVPALGEQPASWLLSLALPSKCVEGNNI